MRRSPWSFCLPLLMGLVLTLAPCGGEVLWTGGKEGNRLRLGAGKPLLGGWLGSEGEELSFSVDRGSSFFLEGGRAGLVVGLLREGLAADARGRAKSVEGCTVRFQEDGQVELVFVVEKNELRERSEWKVQLTRREARELVRVAGKFFDERIEKHAKAEKDGDLD